ncbi:MAG: helix-turn-helix transcriptional regulator [Lentisphaerae bacterium]|nr:helix-turn-helix transcriptional regulator [Lentisphaerota bacterium]
MAGGEGGVEVDAAGPAIRHALRERIKELRCLYAIAMLAERHTGSVEDFLRAAVDELPPSWQYPECAGARIEFRGKAYETAGYRRTPWRQVSPVAVAGERAGTVEVSYDRQMPASCEGPFLREERLLIDGVSEYIGAIAGRILAEQELTEANRLLVSEREALREANAALRAVLARIGEEKDEVARSIRENVERILVPILKSLSLSLPRNKRRYAELLEENLLQIAAPFAGRLAAEFSSLTPTEIAVCNMIRGGIGTKEIARLRGVSPATVSRHREHIRRKLGLAGQRVNLVSFLQQTAKGAEGGGTRGTR